MALELVGELGGCDHPPHPPVDPSLYVTQVSWGATQFPRLLRKKWENWHRHDKCSIAFYAQKHVETNR